MTIRRWILVVALAPLAALAGCADDNPPAVGARSQAAWQPLAVDLDPLVRMPGTQPGGAGNLESPKNCLNCHAGYNSQVEPGHNWKGSMMAQAARDPLFWACLTVAAQDSIWAIGRPNAVDLCERCHFPKGWLEDRSDPPNASLMSGADFDGVQCDFCHKLYDPHFEDSYAGTREGADWSGYWDEASSASQTAATATRQDDIDQAAAITLFNGNSFFSALRPFSAGYTEAASGQYFVAASGPKRGPFQDAGAKHGMLYSRFHKSRYFCASCHDVSNPALANLQHDGLQPGDHTTVLPSEQHAAHSYLHVERTFSEFMLSAYGQQGGAAGVGPFAPAVFDTSAPGNKIARCQDCHMRDVSGVGCNKNSGVDRPSGSSEHPRSGQPLHDLTGGNIWISRVLASTVAGAANYDSTNASLLGQGASVLTLDLSQGEGIDPAALLDGAARAEQQLQLAAALTDLSYDSGSGALSFRVQNQTGHKLLSGFPEGRRMFVNVKVYQGASLLWEVNPYDAAVGTLKGMPDSPTLGAQEEHRNALVYEMKPSSTDLTGEQKTFHFVLATGRYKDNRIPPKGFDISKAAARLSEPVWQGQPAAGYFSDPEYQGGYHQVSLTVPTGADQVVVSLYYQVTSREYVAFLRDEINGVNQTLPAVAYVAQSDPFFAKLKAWGDVIWQLWQHNKDLPGAAPFLMAQETVGGGGPPPCVPPVPELLAAAPGAGQVTLSWSDKHTGDAQVVGYNLYYDQGGKAQLVAQLGLTTSHVDGGLTDGQSYCYKVTSRYAGCGSEPSGVLCATPVKDDGALCGAAGECDSGFCVDSRCCDTACGGGSASDCMACSTAAGAAQNGSCGPIAATIVCRPSAGVCDVAERCSGSSVDCPPDDYAGSSTVCRASAGVCDAAESCSGSGVHCPPDGDLPNGTGCPGGSCWFGDCVPTGVDSGPPPPDQGVPDQGTPDQGTPDQGADSGGDGSPPDASGDAGEGDAAAGDAAPGDVGGDAAAPDASADAAPADGGAGDLGAGDLGGDRGSDDGCSCRAGAPRGAAAGLPTLLVLCALLLLRRRARR